MKKILVLFVIVSTMLLTSCGSGDNNSKETVNSTPSSVDSEVIDTTTTQDGSVPVVEEIESESLKEEEVK
jgi:major membrane immunogen (membrane-anchored lipoprotein)